MKLIHYLRYWCLAVVLIAAQTYAQTTQTMAIHFDKQVRTIKPLIGFLGYLKKDVIPDSLIQAINPSSFRVGWQFTGGTPAGLNATIDKVNGFGAEYMLCMSDLIPSTSTDWTTYENNLRNLVQQVGISRAKTVIWEPANEPDNGTIGTLDHYYDVYKHAFAILRSIDTSLQLAGPGFAYPSFAKYGVFLDTCRKYNLEANVLSWHYTGWDPNSPELQGWSMGRLREYCASYPAQKIKEIECNEWGGPGTDAVSLQPGRAVVWFHYLENIYDLDRAGRADWGGVDDNLGNILSNSNRPLPVYQAYRFYGQTKNQTRVQSDNNGPTLAALASKGTDKNGHPCAEILLGSIGSANINIKFAITSLPMTTYNLVIQQIPAINLNVTLETKDIPVLPATAYTVVTKQDTVFLTISNVAPSQAYHAVFTGTGTTSVRRSVQHTPACSPQVMVSKGSIRYSIADGNNIGEILFTVLDIRGAVCGKMRVSDPLTGIHRIDMRNLLLPEKFMTPGIYIVKMATLNGEHQHGTEETIECGYLLNK